MNLPLMGDQKVLIRFDRNLGFNVTDFELYQDDSSTIQSLAMFFAYDVQKNILNETLYGQKILDPKVFAETMLYSNYRSLIKKHKDPAQFKGWSDDKILAKKEEVKISKEPLWDTLLCNAIYKMRYESLKFSKPGKTPSGLQTSELKEIRFLKSAIKTYDPKTRKISYLIEYDETFVNNLARYFMRLSPYVYGKLRKSKLHDLYTYLINIRDINNKSNIYEQFKIDTLDLNYLCKIAKCRVTRGADKKAYLSKAIKAINEFYGETLFDIEWSKKTPTAKGFYKPIITCHYSEQYIFSVHQEPNERFRIFFHRNLKDHFRKKYAQQAGNLNKMEAWFKKWLNQNDTDPGVKERIFINTYIQCYGREPYIPKVEDDTYKKIEEILNAPLTINT